MKELGLDSRQQAILQSAWKAFATYGFRKTSMDDIARGAGISRPALYLHYRNKEDIFRTLVQYYYDVSDEGICRALAEAGTPREALEAAFAAQGGEVMEAILTSPHGREFLDLGLTTAADLKQAGEARLTAIYADWLAAQHEAGLIRLTGTAPDMAATMTAALKGIKMMAPDHATYQAQVAQLAAMFGAGLTRD